MNQFNWRRALEGAVVSAIISGATAAQVALADTALTVPAIVSTILSSFLIAVIKGFGQAYQTANTLTMTIAQPTNPTVVTTTENLKDA